LTEKKMARAVGRLDDTIAQLEKLHEVAHSIFDAHIDDVRRQCPGVPWSTLKICEIAGPAGSSMDIVRGLKILREKFIGEPYPDKKSK
jgi:hypothetical protein